MTTMHTQIEESPYIPTYYREQGITATNCNDDVPARITESQETPVEIESQVEMDIQELETAREDVAARLERLARRVRQSPITEVAKFDEAYSEIVKLASALRPLLQLPAPGPAYKG